MQDLDPELNAVALFFFFTSLRRSTHWSGDSFAGNLIHMGMPRRFMEWIALLYAEPEAHIQVNQETSDPISLTRGTRQECPLTPVLFAVAMKPMASMLRQRYSQYAIPYPAGLS